MESSSPAEDCVTASQGEWQRVETETELRSAAAAGGRILLDPWRLWVVLRILHFEPSCAWTMMNDNVIDYILSFIPVHIELSGVKEKHCVDRHWSPGGDLVPAAWEPDTGPLVLSTDTIIAGRGSITCQHETNHVASSDEQDPNPDPEWPALWVRGGAKVRITGTGAVATSRHTSPVTFLDIQGMPGDSCTSIEVSEQSTLQLENVCAEGACCVHGSSRLCVADSVVIGHGKCSDGIVAYDSGTVVSLTSSQIQSCSVYGVDVFDEGTLTMEGGAVTDCHCGLYTENDASVSITDAAITGCIRGVITSGGHLHLKRVSIRNSGGIDLPNPGAAVFLEGTRAEFDEVDIVHGCGDGVRLYNIGDNKPQANASFRGVTIAHHNLCGIHAWMNSQDVVSLDAECNVSDNKYANILCHQDSNCINSTADVIVEVTEDVWDY